MFYFSIRCCFRVNSLTSDFNFYFVSEEQKVALRLKEPRKWLLNCGYHGSVIDKSFFNAKLQGPTNKPANSTNILPLASTNYSNFDRRNMIKSIKSKRINQSPATVGLLLIFTIFSCNYII